MEYCNDMRSRSENARGPRCDRAIANEYLRYEWIKSNYSPSIESDQRYRCVIVANEIHGDGSALQRLNQFGMVAEYKA